MTIIGLQDYFYPKDAGTDIVLPDVKQLFSWDATF